MRLAGVVVGFVVLAGCHGGLVAETPSPTVTPAPLPSETTTPRAVIPGVTHGRLVDPATLTDRHRAVLSGRGHSQVRVERAHTDAGLAWRLTVRTRVAPDGRAHAVIRPSGPAIPPTIRPGTTRIERYVGETATWVAVWRDGTRRVTRYPQAFAVGRPQLYPVLGALHLKVTDRRRQGERVTYRLVGREVRDAELLSTAARHRDVTDPLLVATVTDRGVVRRYEFTYTVDEPSSTTSRSYGHEFHVTAVGETTVPVPSWVPRTNVTDRG